jgi:hypothetical protein
MGIRPGSQAPDSTWQVLWDNGRTDGTQYLSLSDYRGKVVVLIFVQILG